MSRNFSKTFKIRVTVFPVIPKKKLNFFSSKVGKTKLAPFIENPSAVYSAKGLYKVTSTQEFNYKLFNWKIFASLRILGINKNTQR